MDDGQLSRWSRRSHQLGCWSTRRSRVWMPAVGRVPQTLYQPECINRQAVTAALKATDQFSNEEEGLLYLEFNYRTEQVEQTGTCSVGT